VDLAIFFVIYATLKTLMMIMMMMMMMMMGVCPLASTKYILLHKITLPISQFLPRQ